MRLLNASRAARALGLESMTGTSTTTYARQSVKATDVAERVRSSGRNQSWLQRAGIVGSATLACLGLSACGSSEGARVTCEEYVQIAERIYAEDNGAFWAAQAQKASNEVNRLGVELQNLYPELNGGMHVFRPKTQSTAVNIPDNATCEVKREAWDAAIDQIEGNKVFAQSDTMTAEELKRDIAEARAKIASGEQYTWSVM